MSPSGVDRPRILLIAHNGFDVPSIEAMLAAEGLELVAGEPPVPSQTTYELVIVDLSDYSDVDDGENISRIADLSNRRSSTERPVPVLALVGPSISVRPTWANAIVAWPDDAQSIPYRVRSLLARSGNLTFVLKRFDSTTERLASDEICEWVRCRLGVFGVVSAPGNNEVLALCKDIDLRTMHAYGVIDQLPTEVLRFEDMWNLVLFIAVPWSKEDAIQSVSISDALLTYERDTRGSRKVVLWRDTSPEDFLHPFSYARTPSEHLARDPLGETLRSAALDDDEWQALQVLYKARISQNELDALVRALGRRVTR